MGMRKRPDDQLPWLRGYQYGALLPALSVNLIVAETQRSADFYRDVFEAEVHYCDIDFGALRFGPAEVMLHADHTHQGHPWIDVDLAAGAPRGVGAQFRILGIDPDALHERAVAFGATVVSPPASKGHGWREVLVRDPDGYEWACGVLVGAAKGPHPSVPAPTMPAS